MKGKQLTLEEVLNLEDGTKVWVEDNRKDLEFVRQTRKLVHSYKDYFDKLFQHLIIYSGAINPTGLYKRCTEFATKVGEKVPHKYGFDYN